MKIFKVLGEKAWIPHPAGTEFTATELNENKKVGKIALKFFIAVVSVIFFLITITFVGRSQLEDFQALAGEPWQPFSDPKQLWMNTGALFFSSVSIHFAKLGTQKNHQVLIMMGIFTATFFALAFLFGQLVVWQELIALGYYVSSNPANSYFYLYTSLHGLHLLGGLLALFYVVGRFLKDSEPQQLSRSISLCATYWHFMLLVWVLLFALLTSTPETYATIARLCGF